MSVGDNIRRRRKELGMSAEELAEKIGKSPATVYRYENGFIKSVDSAALLPIADALGVTPGYLMGWADLFTGGAGETHDLSAGLKIAEERLPSNVRPMSELHVQRVPLIGAVAAGEPIYAPEELGVYVDTPVQCDAAITIQGDSMVPNYLDGDVVYIKCRPDVPDGAVAVVFLDDEATLKHVYKREKGLTLISDNPDHPPLMVEFEDYARVRVFGVPVGYTRMFKPDPLKKLKKGMR